MSLSDTANHAVSTSAQPIRRAPRNVTLSRGYYRAVLLVLLDGLQNGLTNHDIAVRLNHMALPTPTGSQWTSESVKGLFKRLKHHTRYPTKFYNAMLECVYWGEMTQAQTVPLIVQNRQKWLH